MIRYYNICRKYFKLKANNPKFLIPLCISALLRSTVVLGFPVFSSQIIEYATIGDYKKTLLSLLFLGINYTIYKGKME